MSKRYITVLYLRVLWFEAGFRHVNPLAWDKNPLPTEFSSLGRVLFLFKWCTFPLSRAKKPFGLYLAHKAPPSFQL